MDIMEIFNSDLVSLILVPILVGILNAIKATKIISEKYIPILSVILGALLGILFNLQNIPVGLIVGLMIGLAAVGLFSGVKNVTEGLKEE